MRIVIDMQGAQTESRFRGIGRYSVSLSKAIIRNRGKHEIILVLNGLFPDSIESIRNSFKGLLPQENIRVWYTPGPVKECDPANGRRREVAELIREAYLAKLRPDVVLVMSLFEGYIDDAVTSVGAFAKQLPTAVILYDLIPLLNSELYLSPAPLYETGYCRKIESLKTADIWLAISGFAAQEGCTVLGRDASHIFNISTACDDVFCPLEISEEVRTKILNSYAIKNKFVLYSGCADARKGLPRLIQAYGQLPENLRQNYQLVFAGKMASESIDHLQRVAQKTGLRKNEIVFTGYVTDADLAYLYNLCCLFVFPSLHEGFGLPALEAMSCGAAVIGSNKTSVPEVIDRDDALFDPQDLYSIVGKLEHVLENSEFRLELAEHGIRQSKKFSWDDTAGRAITALEQLYETTSQVFSTTFCEEEIVKRLVNAITTKLDSEKSGETDMLIIAASIAKNHPEAGRIRKIFVDVSELVQHDAATGIQRVTRAILRELLLNHPEELDIRAVYSPAGSGIYMQASRFTRSFFPAAKIEDYDFIIEPQNGDIFVGLDLQPQRVFECQNFYRYLRQLGAQVFFVVYDLLPVTLPDAFPPGTSETYTQWLDTVADGDGAICISNSVADSLKKWLDLNKKSAGHQFLLKSFQLGADIENSVPSLGLPLDVDSVLSSIQSMPTFLMVGTIEPRKGHKQTLAAFDILWDENHEIGLVIVGKPGWLVDDLVGELNNHPQINKRLFWLKDVSDEYLHKIYEASTCLLAASAGEGFGLPLIEAARHQRPIIARDIPVFREIAGDGAFFFSGFSPQALTSSVKKWLTLYAQGAAPRSDSFQWITWAESTKQFLGALLRTSENVQCDSRQKRHSKSKGRPLSEKVRGSSLRALILSPYPIRHPRHGGQVRTAAIRNAFLAANYKVQTIGFYQSEAYALADIDDCDIAFPTESPYRLYKGQLLPEMSDVLMGTFSTSDEKAFQQVVSCLRDDVDVIFTEQPWFYPLAQRLKHEVSHCQNALVVFSSQNIEAPMKRQILGTSATNLCIDAIIEDIAQIEIAAAQGADLSVAVTQADAEILQQYGAIKTLVAPNGINPWKANLERVDFWREKLPSQPWPLFIASAHPPNYTGFISSAGDALGCIPPGSRLVVAGSVGPHLFEELTKSRWRLLNETRIQAVGVLDEIDMNTLKSLAHTFLLPIGAGGGSNIKTAEALYSGKPVVCTSLALRGFESYKSLPQVRVADTPRDFQAAVRTVLAHDFVNTSESESRHPLLEQLTWESSLEELPLKVKRMLAKRRPE